MDSLTPFCANNKSFSSVPTAAAGKIFFKAAAFSGSICPLPAGGSSCHPSKTFSNLPKGMEIMSSKVSNQSMRWKDKSGFSIDLPHLQVQVKIHG